MTWLILGFAAVIIAFFLAFAWILSLLNEAIGKREREERKTAKTIEELHACKRRIERLVGESFDACKQRHELHAALYLSDQDAHQTTHQQAVDRAKMLAVLEKNATEHREKAARLDQLAKDNVELAQEITNLKFDSGSWRALRREIADCCGRAVPEDSEPPNHGDCVEMLWALQAQNKCMRELLVQSQDMLQKYVDASAAFSATVAGVDCNVPDHSETIKIGRGEMVSYCPCGRVLPGGSLCNCKVCCESRANPKCPDLSEPLSPAMGVSGNVAEALIPTGDSIENSPVKPEIKEWMSVCQRNELLNARTGRSLPADFGIDCVLAHAEARSNGHG